MRSRRAFSRSCSSSAEAGADCPGAVMEPPHVRTAIKRACAASILFRDDAASFGCVSPPTYSLFYRKAWTPGEALRRFQQGHKYWHPPVEGRLAGGGDQRLPKFSGSKLGPGCCPPPSDVRTTLCPVSSKRLRQRIFRQATISSTRTIYERAFSNRLRSSEPAPRGNSFFFVRTTQRMG